ncbi:MAG: hypothetical protein K5656_10620 [Lachnospiraceae bacterium]|nr:hypothetical protein [Lachnospiraceae bacterium]
MEFLEKMISGEGTYILIVMFAVFLLFEVLFGYLWNYFISKELKEMNKNIKSLETSVYSYSKRGPYNYGSMNSSSNNSNNGV